MAGGTVYGQPAIEAATPADLDHIAKGLGIGRLADQTRIKRHALGRNPLQQFLGAVDRRAFLVAGDQKRDRAIETIALLAQKLPGGGGETGDRGFHVGGAPAIEHAVLDFGAEGIGAPTVRIAHRHRVGMAGKTEMRRAGADAGIEIGDVGGAVLGEGLELAGEADFLQRAFEHA